MNCSLPSNTRHHPAPPCAMSCPVSQGKPPPPSPPARPTTSDELARPGRDFPPPSPSAKPTTLQHQPTDSTPPHPRAHPRSFMASPAPISERPPSPYARRPSSPRGFACPQASPRGKGGLAPPGELRPAPLPHLEGDAALLVQEAYALPTPGGAERSYAPSAYAPSAYAPSAYAPSATPAGERGRALAMTSGGTGSAMQGEATPHSMANGFHFAARCVKEASHFERRPRRDVNEERPQPRWPAGGLLHFRPNLAPRLCRRRRNVLRCLFVSVSACQRSPSPPPPSHSFLPSTPANAPQQAGLGNYPPTGASPSPVGLGNYAGVHGTNGARSASPTPASNPPAWDNNGYASPSPGHYAFLSPRTTAGSGSVPPRLPPPNGGYGYGGYGAASPQGGGTPRGVSVGRTLAAGAGLAATGQTWH